MRCGTAKQQSRFVRRTSSFPAPGSGQRQQQLEKAILSNALSLASAITGPVAPPCTITEVRCFATNFAALKALASTASIANLFGRAASHGSNQPSRSQQSDSACRHPTTGPDVSDRQPGESSMSARHAADVSRQPQGLTGKPAGATAGGGGQKRKSAKQAGDGQKQLKLNSWFSKPD